MLDKEFWKDRKVLLTGHTGFKGSWLALWLSHLGAKVYGYSLPPNTNPSMFKLCEVSRLLAGNVYADIREVYFLTSFMQQLKPSVILHLAAQPLVRDSYLYPVQTFTTNIIGTLRVLEAARTVSSLEAIEIITTDKCYKALKDTGYYEEDQLGGKDPYSASKACAEIVTEAYRESFFKNKVPVMTARAGNVIGGGDWAKDRLITTALHSINNNKILQLRNPNAIRPWQHVLDVVYGYLRLIEEAVKQGEVIAGAWNFGPNYSSTTVAQCIDKFFNYYGIGSWEKTVGQDDLVETPILRLNCIKAIERLKWWPRYNIDRTIKLTVDWDKKFAEGSSMFAITMNQIYDYNQ